MLRNFDFQRSLKKVHPESRQDVLYPQESILYINGCPYDISFLLRFMDIQPEHNKNAKKRKGQLLLTNKFANSENLPLWPQIRYM